MLFLFYYINIMTNNQKDFNRDKYSKKCKKYKNGKRPHSPWYFLIGKIEKNFFNKCDLDEDFSVVNFNSDYCYFIR